MEYVFAFSPDGQVCYEAHTAYAGDVPFDAFQVNYPGCVVGVYEENQFDGAPLDQLTATINNGEVQVIHWKDAPTPYYVHSVFTGGDGMTPPGVVATSSPAKSPPENTIKASFYITADADGQVPLPINDVYRMRLRDKATGQALMIEAIALVNGRGAKVITLNDNSPCGELVLSGKDLAPINGMVGQFVAPVEIIIYKA